MQCHPHVHLLVTAGGLLADGTEWLEPKHASFLVPVEALSVIFRAELCAALKKAGPLGEVPPTVWKKKWVVHCRAAGYGQKVLDYLGRYVFRVAITNSRLLQDDPEGLGEFLIAIHELGRIPSGRPTLSYHRLTGDPGCQRLLATAS